VVGGASFSALGGDVAVTGMAKTYDGPWQKPEGTKAFLTYSKYSRMTDLGQVSLSLSTYQSTWDPTEQIADRAIGTLIPDAFGSLDPFMHGRTRREIASLQLDGEAWHGNVYAQHYDWRMISNSTYFLDDPVNGDEFEQAERLWTYGYRLERRLSLGDQWSFLLGSEGRYDDIGSVGLFSTVHGHRTAPRALFAVDEASAALFAEATWKPVERLSITGGVRGDAYHFKTKPLAGDSWAGTASDQIFLPKIGASYEVADGIAVYANWGQGFHSNDSRAVTNPVGPADGLIRGTGKEVGTRFERYHLVATASYWWFDSDSELVFSGDANTVEPSGASERHGYELTAFWRPLEGLAIDGVWTWTHARFKDAPGHEFIEGALKNSGELGVTYIRPSWNVSGRLRYMGAHPLTDDGAHFSEPTTIVNLRAAWTPKRYEVFAELLNALNSDAKDIEYWYESYLPAIDLNGPVEGQHSRAVEPRMVRGGIRINF
jgi:outer membrane receptor protein involved in Fe transport